MRPTQQALGASRQRVLERLSRGRPMQHGVIAVLRSARRDLEVDENRTLLGQYGTDPLLEILQIGEHMRAAISRRAGEPGEVNEPAPRRRVAAVCFVGSVFADEMEEILRSRFRRTDQAAD